MFTVGIQCVPSVVLTWLQAECQDPSPYRPLNLPITSIARILPFFTRQVHKQVAKSDQRDYTNLPDHITFRSKLRTTRSLLLANTQAIALSAQGEPEPSTRKEQPQRRPSSKKRQAMKENMPPSTRTTASLLPLLPRIFFLYLEPVVITYGASMAYAHRLPLLATLSPSPSSFSPSSSSASPPALDLAVLSAPGLSATYLVCMMFYGLMILLSTPPNVRLLKLHIGLLALADVAHWLVLLATAAEASPHGESWLDLAAPAAWWHDETARLLVVAPLGSFCFKIATLMGVFGRIGEV
ncbi:hypothetical protein BJ166DRAFT_111110 [Pestalotiopsis sp. NC0098]|nr:hypothetical protein BJ166DRAFT_111110 [Pestalotiopsis sp. NC0098]